MSSIKSDSSFARVGFSLNLKKVDPSNLTSPMTGISNSNKLESDLKLGCFQLVIRCHLTCPGGTAVSRLMH